VNDAPAWTDVEPPADDQDGADAGLAYVAGALRRLGHTGEGVVLAVPSAWCLVATVSTAGIPRHDRKALLYRLEERLPLAAEAIVADFARAPDGVTGGGTDALGVCVRTEQVLPIVAGLEAAGVPVRSVAPLAFLVAQGLAAGGSAAAIPDPAVVAANPLRAIAVAGGPGEPTDLIAVLSGAPVAWALVEGGPADVARRLDLLAAELGTVPRLEGVGFDGRGWADLTAGRIAAGAGAAGTTAAAPPVLHGEPAVAAALRAAAGALADREPPWVELRRDALASADRLRPYRRAGHRGRGGRGAVRAVRRGGLGRAGRAVRRRGPSGRGAVGGRRPGRVPRPVRDGLGGRRAGGAGP
jgi:hypothetical protein